MADTQLPVNQDTFVIEGPGEYMSVIGVCFTIKSQLNGIME